MLLPKCFSVNVGKRKHAGQTSGSAYIPMLNELNERGTMYLE